MHILLIVDHYPLLSDVHRGVKFRQHIKYYQKHGHQVSVLAVNQRPIKNLFSGILDYLKKGSFYTIETDQGAPIYRDYSAQFLAQTHFYKFLLFLGINHNVLRTKISARLFSKIQVAQGMPDIIHAHGSQWSGASAYIINKKVEIPYVLTEHMTIYERNLVKSRDFPFMQCIFHKASYLFTISDNLKNILEQKIGSDYLSQTCTMPNMLDPELFKISGKHDTADKFVFFSISRLVEMKRFDLMLNAFAMKFKGQYQYRLRIGGDGELSSDLKAQAKKLGIENQVCFLGALDRATVVTEIQECDAYLLSSDYETFGIPLVEAGFCGKPVVATRVTGPDSIVSEGVGLLVPKDDVQAFANAMEEMTKSVSQYDPQKIRSYYIERYSAPNIINRLTQIYEQVLS